MRKRVVHLLSSDIYSGAESVTVSIIKSLEEEYEFIYVSPSGSIEKILNDKGIKHISLDNINPITLKRLFEQLKPDIVHAHDFKASVKLAFTNYKCKKISHLHQNPTWIKKINHYSIIYGISSLFYDNIITVSSQIIEEAIFSKIAYKKMKLLNNYVDKKTVIKNSLEPYDGEKYDILFIGRLEEEKDPLRFIKLSKDLVDVFDDIKIGMVGNGSLKNDCDELIKTYKIESNVDMIGFQSNPHKVIKNSKVLVITSKWEGFGLAAVESMILGKPVITTPVGGLKSIIDLNCGRFYSTDEEFIIETLLILNNDSLYNKLSKNSEIKSKIYSDEQQWKNNINLIYNY